MWDVPYHRLILRVQCSAGAYIRSLAHDLGIALGTYGHLTGLRREAVGAFTIEEAHTLDAINEAVRAGNFEKLLCGAGDRLPMPSITIDGERLRRLSLGQTQAIELPDGRQDMLCQIRNDDRQLMGILRALRPAEFGHNQWFCRAEKWLA